MSATSDYLAWRDSPAGRFAAENGTPAPLPPREVREYLLEPGVNAEKLMSDPMYLKQLQIRDQFRGVPAVNSPPAEEVIKRMTDRWKLDQSSVRMGRSPDGTVEWQGPPAAVEMAKQQDAEMQQRVAEIAAGQHTIYPGSNGVA